MIYIYNNFTIFRVYLIIAIIILLPACFFITIELFNFINYWFIIKFSINNDNRNIFFLCRYYLKKQKWFTCILMLESFQELSSLGCHNLLGICYHKISYNYIAEYYYSKALNNDLNNITILQNLAYIYKNLGYTDKFQDVCSKIVSLDPNNEFIVKNFNK